MHIEAPSLRNSHVFFLITLVACIIYAKSVAYQYTYSDDTQLLVVNQEFLSNLANFPKLFTTDVFISITNPNVFYRPLMNFLFMLELQVSKDSPAIFHITNILLHIGCSYLLFLLFRQLGVARQLAILSALLFCVHPLNTSAVVWIPGRNDTLLALLVLASFSMFLRAVETRRVSALVWHFVFFFLALLTKEPAVALPILCAGYAFLVRKEKYNRATIFAVAASYAVLLAIWFFLRGLVVRGYAVHESLFAFGISWLQNAPAFILYIGKVFLPFNLSVFPNLADNSLILGFISVLALVAAYLIHRPASYREILWGLSWFFLFLAPTFLSGTIFHEHRNYCSFFGFLFAVVQLPLVQKFRFEKTVHALGSIALLGLFSILAMVHSEHFRNRTAYATNAFVSSPSVDESYSAFAGLLLDEGDDAAAERVLQEGIARKPKMMAVHRMLGDIYAMRHDYARAANEYETSIRLEPLQLYTYINYGKMCLDAGKVDDAERLWKRSVLINPDFLLGYYYLANFYVHVKNDPDSAMIYAKKIQDHGVTVMPELLRAIEENPSYGKRKQ